MTELKRASGIVPEKDRAMLGAMGDRWRTAMQDRAGGYSRRTVDDASEREFWQQYFARGTGCARDPYAEPILAAACEILGDRRYDSILELGPGWGNYTFGLAERCRTMHCVDISPDVLTYIRRTGAEQGYSISTTVSRWEDYSGPGAEAVFAYNCFYRMREIEEGLRKFDAMGSRLHIMGMTGGPEKSWYPVLEDRLGLDIGRRHLDYIYLVNVLYQLGIDCSVRLVPGIRDYVFESFEAALADTCRRILTEEYDREAVAELLREYVLPEEDGRWHYHHPFRAALLYW